MTTPDQLAIAGFGMLPIGEYAFPGVLRDRLVAAIKSGAKTTTSSLVVEYLRTGERLPRKGDREVVVDSAGRPVCVTEVSQIVIARLSELSLDHAIAEGEGFTDLAHWRTAHEEFWCSPEFVAELGEPALELSDHTEVVCATFRVIARLT